MGLDMYAMTTATRPEAPTDFEAEDAVRLHYWRKHPNLHGWMQERYYEKGGATADFNCATLELTSEDLDDLEEAVREGALPYTIGSFFGESDGSESEDDLAFIAKARKAIKGGLTVFYDSWW